MLAAEYANTDQAELQATLPGMAFSASSVFVIVG